MKYFLLLFSTGLLWGRVTATEGPANVVQLFATPENITLIREADKVDACILRHVEATTRPDGSVDRTTERYEETTFVSVPPAAAVALRDILLSEKTYDWKAGNGGRRPQFYLRLRFHQLENVINIDFCFMCHVLSVTQPGKEIGHANFSPNSDLFLQSFLPLFPEDAALKRVAKEAGLPL